MLCSSDADSAREQEILSLLVGMSLRGVIIMPSATTLDRLGMLVERGIRVVLMDHPPIPEMSTVVGDDVSGARAAISHLLEIGHRDNTDLDTLEKLAERHRLVRTGSSDYHGSGKPNRLGENTTAPEVLRALASGCFLEVIHS